MVEKVRSKLIDILAMEKTYSNIFRAFVAMAALSLVAMGQGFPALYQAEKEATKLKFELEAQFNSKLELIDCEKIKEKQVECNFAKYQMKAVGSGITLLDSIIEICNILASILAIFAVAGFFLSFANSADNRTSDVGAKVIESK